MTDSTEQRTCIKFCVSNEINATKTFEMLQKAFGDKCLSRSRTFEWYKRVRQSHSKIKVLLTVFFDYRGVVHQEFLPIGQTVNKEYYLGVKRRLRESVKRKRPDLWQNNTWFLHHDNAPAHTSLLVRDFLTKNSTNVIDQVLYSPDLAPCDFFLFPKLKLLLRGNRFESIDEMKAESLCVLKAIPQDAYEKCFRDWQNRWHKCILQKGTTLKETHLIYRY